jgi:predicted transcriptional regulator of viral defense system
MPGSNYNAIYDTAVEQYGFVTTDDVRELGIDTRRLVDMRKHRHLTRVSSGVYRLNAIPATPYDQYMAAVLWHRGLGVLSHETALDLYDVSDINPAKIHVTVPTRPRVTREVPPIYVLYRENLPAREITRFEGIPIVTLETAIRQCAQIHVGRHLLRQAIDNGERTGRLRAAQAAALREELDLPAAAPAPTGATA